MKKIKNVVVAVFFFLICIIKVDANVVEKIDIDGYLDSNGDLHVTEVWDVTTNRDTEMYIQKYNLGNMEITDFSVIDEDRSYTLNEYWDIYADFASKTHKYGIVRKSNGDLELCWGISEYGSKRYTIKYIVKNAVFLTKDAQVLYMTFINPSSLKTKAFYVDIKSDNSFSDALPVWGYGYKGYAYVQNGVVSMSNDTRRNLYDNEYAALLIQFPLNTFNVESNNKYKEFSTFDDVLKKAKEGTFDNSREKINIFQIITSALSFLFENLYFIIVLFFIFSAIFKSSKYKFGPAGKSIKMKDINYFRDIPCRKDIYRAYFLAQAYGLNKKNTDFFGSILLKLLDQGKVNIEKKEHSRLFGNKQVVNIIMNENAVLENDVESELYSIMLEASVDGILEEDELKNWSKANYKELLKWFDKAEEYGRDLYVEDALVGKVRSKYLLDDKIKPEAIELAGLKKYLKDFTLIHEKEPIEVKLWKEYLMYAQIFGLAEQVAKQFKDLYPEIVEDMERNQFDLNTFILMNNFSGVAISSAEGARRAAEAAARSYSSGGGGFSSGGGGGGSFGGGGSSGSR